MTLTKLTNLSGDFEYVNLEQIATISIGDVSGTSYYNIIFSGGVETHIAITDTAITTLVAAT